MNTDEQPVRLLPEQRERLRAGRTHRARLATRFSEMPGYTWTPALERLRVTAHLPGSAGVVDRLELLDMTARCVTAIREAQA